MAIIHPQQGTVAVTQRAHGIQLRHGSVHGEHAVGEYQCVACAAGRLLQTALQVRHVVVPVAPALRLAQADAIDDGGVVQLVADDGVLLPQERLKEPAVGIECRRVQNRVFHAQEARQRFFQIAVQILRAADETHRAHAVAVACECCVGCAPHSRIGRQPQVVVGAQVQNLAAAAVGGAGGDVGALRVENDPLGFIQTGCLQGIQFGRQVPIKRIVGHW